MYMQRTFAIGNRLAFVIVLLFFLKFYPKVNSAISVLIVAIFVMYRLLCFGKITVQGCMTSIVCFTDVFEAFYFAML